MDKERVSITLVGDNLHYLKRAATDAGMSLSQYCMLCVSIGIKTMRRITEPETVYTPEQQVALMAAMGFDKVKLEAMILEKNPELIESRLPV